MVLPHIFIVMQMKFVECTIVQQLSWLVEQEKSVCNWLHCMLVHFSWRLWCITIWPLEILPVIFNQCLYIYICFKTKPNYWSPVPTIIVVDSRFKSSVFFLKNQSIKKGLCLLNLQTVSDKQFWCISWFSQYQCFWLSS